MDKYQALHGFWSGVDLPAYDENTVPETAVMPYITYEAIGDSFDSRNMLSASLWYYSLSWSEISKKSDEISEYIGMGGIMVPYDDGALWVSRGTPFAQRMSDPDPEIRRVLLNIQIEYLSVN